MTVAKIYLGHDSQEKIKEKITDEQYIELRKYFKNFPENRAEYNYWIHGNDLLIDIEIEGKLLSDLGFEFLIKQLKGLINLSPYVSSAVTEGKQSTVVQVHVPNIGLFSVNEVDVLQDCCTETLQDKLDEGWHILAVCPPNNQRRPDYIMGRIKEK